MTITRTEFGNSVLDAADKWLQSQRYLMEEELIELCNLNSGSDHYAGLLAVSDFLELLFGDLPVPCQRIPLADRMQLESDGTWQPQPTGPLLHWQSPPMGNCRALLAIHYDTVYDSDSPFQKCERLDANRLQGPGVIDAKGGIIVLRWAVKAGLHFGLLNQVDWSIVLNPDEEVGSLSSAAYFASHASEYDVGLLFEPAMADGSLVHERKGTGTFVYIVRGVSAHSGRNFADGRNALALAAKIAVELDALNGVMPGVTINVGYLRSGGAVNIVPDLAILKVNVRLENRDQQEWIELQTRAIANRAHQPDHGFQCELHGGITSPPKQADTRTRNLIRAVERAASMVGQSIQWKLSGGASDGNKLAAIGLANIDTFGPEGDGLHTHHEWISLPSLPQKALLTLATLQQLPC